VFRNGTVLTMEEGSPQAQAIAIQGPMILAVGSDEEVLPYRGSQTQVIDLQGRTLMPGFVDPHTHLFDSPDFWGVELLGAQELALRHGLTTVGNAGTRPELVSDMLALADTGQVRVRTSLYLVYADNCGQVQGDWYLQHRRTDNPGEMLRIGGVKVFADGGSCGCPAYSYDHPRCGLGDLWFTQAQMNTMLADIHAAGYQVAVHALGDRAVEQALDAIEYALAGQPNTQRHRIEHNGVVRDDMLSRYSETGVVALIFGNYACKFVPFVPPPAYQSWEWRWRDLMQANPTVHFAWHGDAPPVGPLQPLLHLYAMVSSHEVSADGLTICDTPAWLAREVFTPAEALRLMTIDAAYALFRDDEVGSLRAGKYADLIILSGNPLTVQPEAIKDIQVLTTLVGGAVEHCAPGWEDLCPVGE